MYMKPIGMKLTWITVKNIEESIQFYTTIIGLELKEFNEEHGWAELTGNEGARLGLYQSADGSNVGTNGVITITVEDIEKAVFDLKSKNVTLLDGIIEIKDTIKMQTFEDSDGNTFQLCQLLKNIKQ